MNERPNLKQTIVAALDDWLVSSGVDTRGVDFYKGAQRILNAIDDYEDLI
jgi:hypothetical protein